MKKRRKNPANVSQQDFSRDFLPLHAHPRRKREASQHQAPTRSPVIRGRYGSCFDAFDRADGLPV